MSKLNLTIGVAAGFLLFLLGWAAPPFKSVAARDATADYDGELRRAEEDYYDRVGKARQAYRIALEKAKQSALKGTGDLEEANAIQARLKAIEAEIKAKPVKLRVNRGLVIDRVMYGAGDKWVEVTDKVRAAMKDNSVNVTKAIADVPDPAFGAHKELVIEGGYGGRDLFIRGGGGKLIVGGSKEEME